MNFKRLVPLLPWVTAAAIFGLLFHRIPLADAWDAAVQARLAVFIPASLVTSIVCFWLESSAVAQLFSRFNAPLTWQEARSLRAVTYLLTPINWHLGTGAMAVHLHASKGVAVLESTSSLFFYSLIDCFLMGTSVLAGVLVLPSSPVLQTIGGFAAVMVAVPSSLLAFCMLRSPKWGWVQRVKSVGFLRTYCLVTWSDAGVLLVIRAAYFAVTVFFFWVGAGAFNVHVPLTYMAAAVPIILIIGSLPVTPGGLGTRQAAALYLFEPYGSEAQILAFGLAFTVVGMLLRLMLGLFYLRNLRLLRAYRARPAPTN